MHHAKHFSHASLSLAALLCVAHAEPINNPFPERIPKADITIELQPISKDLASPVLAVAAPDNAKRLFIVDQAGFIREALNGQVVPAPFLDVSGRLADLNKDFDERGFLGLAFDPDYQKPGAPGHRRIFTFTSEPVGPRTDFPLAYSTEPPNCQSVVASWKVSADGTRVEVDSRREILRFDKPQMNHDGGMLAFGPDGFLYISTGDGGAANDLGAGHNPEIGNAQDKNVLLGKMLRIDVNGADSANKAYGIPKDNPFASGGGAREIYALGLRNPWRFSFDGAMLLAGDVGQNKLDYVYKVDRGGNYGWRLKEGAFKFNMNGTIEAPGPDLPKDLIDPILQYDHDEGTSVMGGFVYRGKAIPALDGLYIFGDYQKPGAGTGRLFVAKLPNGPIQELRIGNDDRTLGFLLKGFGQDGDGELYACGSLKPGPKGPGGIVVKLVPVSGVK